MRIALAGLRRRFASQRASRARQVVFGGDLHVVGVSLDDVHAMIRDARPATASSVTSMVEVITGSNASTTSRRKPCGVCASARSSRGIVPSIQRWCTVAHDVLHRVVYAERPAMAAPSLAAASITRPMTASVTNGRAASCTSTTSASSGTAARPAATESCRRAPPATIAQQLGTSGGRRQGRARCSRSAAGHDGHDAAYAGRCGARRDAALEDRAVAEWPATASRRTPPRRRPWPPAATTTSTITRRAPCEW